MSEEHKTAEFTGISRTIVEGLKGVDSCTVANAVESFGVRLRNEGYIGDQIVRRFPSMNAMVGHVVTLQIRCSSPPPVGRAYPDPTEWWDHLLKYPAPRIVVIQDMDEKPGSGSFLGAIHGTILASLGCVGVVTNGAVRDLPGLAASGLQVFSSHVSPSHGYAHIVSYGEPVEIAGLRMHPGDLLHGDEHGVVSIPRQIGDQLLSCVVMFKDRERRIIESCRLAGPDTQTLRKAVKEIF